MCNYGLVFQIERILNLFVSIVLEQIAYHQP